MQRIGSVHGCSPSAEANVAACTMVFHNCKYNPWPDENREYSSIGMA